MVASRIHRHTYNRCPRKDKTSRGNMFLQFPTVNVNPGALQVPMASRVIITLYWGGGRESTALFLRTIAEFSADCIRTACLVKEPTTWSLPPQQASNEPECSQHCHRIVTASKPRHESLTLVGPSLNNPSSKDGDGNSRLRSAKTSKSRNLGIHHVTPSPYPLLTYTFITRTVREGRDRRGFNDSHSHSKMKITVIGAISSLFSLHPSHHHSTQCHTIPLSRSSNRPSH
jgi:hypothetical protein